MVKIKATNLQRVTYLVFDEADRMFDLGFGKIFLFSISIMCTFFFIFRGASSINRKSRPTGSTVLDVQRYFQEENRTLGAGHSYRSDSSRSRRTRRSMFLKICILIFENKNNFFAGERRHSTNRRSDGRSSEIPVATQPIGQLLFK